LLDEGQISGKNFVQVGLHSMIPIRESLEWMRQHQVRYHMMAEIKEKGMARSAGRDPR
jgi:arginase family enzyme